ncbi:MAG: protein kinase [Acidobacteriota bacterium]|nr:MAG: protein kinase [Acidobacteriota bacterium]
MIGRSLAHYEITEKLGQGGMGEVYRATDTKLGRQVALKILLPVIASNPDGFERFRREAKLLAALDHPSIVGVYSVEEGDGVHFLTMQFVEGQSLDQFIPEGGLPLDEILKISTALADALAAAHEKGVVHRDLKPANIMVTPAGQVKVLDFGLAKIVSGQEPSGNTILTTVAQTREGMVMGTVPYMSPEQVSGRSLDHRTDIFSLGVVLYEMACGKRPFEERSVAELISAILRDEPSAVTEVRSDLPPVMEDIIRRCMEKEADQRFQTAAEISDGIRSLTAGRQVASQTLSSRRTPRGGEMWIAVLPFESFGVDPELELLSDGLVQDITAALSQFSYLSVIARDLTQRFKGESVDVRKVREEINASYVIRGGLRRSGNVIRVNVQLIDAQNGKNLWAETYNRDLNDTDIFAVQDDITDRVAATVADNFGVLVRSMVASLEGKPDGELSATEYVLRWFGYEAKRLTPKEHAVIRATLESGVSRMPQNAEVWGCLSFVHFHECAFGFNATPDSFERVLATAQRAVELNRASQIAHEALAWAHFVRQDLGAIPAAVERAVSLNPRNSHVLAVAGLILVHTREFERGAAIARRAIELNPHHAGWFHFPLIWDHFSRGEYEKVLERAKRVNMPGFFWTPLVIAVVCAELGREQEAAAALAELRSIDPEFGAHARRLIEPWNYASGFIEPLLEGLRKAGLDVSESNGADMASEGPPSKRGRGLLSESDSRSVPQTSASGTIRHYFDDTVPWIAVLPLKYKGKDPEIESFAEGLTEDITTGLSRFSYLFVVSPSSAARFKEQVTDSRLAGQELGTRYVVEGGIRRAGARIRVSVQVIDTSTGTHLWAETYDRDFESGGTFSIQDEITDHVVATIADPFGVVARTMSAPTASKAADALTPHEAVLRFFLYLQRISPEDHLIVRSALQRAVEIQPDYADGWACLSQSVLDEHKHMFNPLPNPLERALEAAQKATDADPASQMAYLALAETQYYLKDLGAFRAAADRAVAINRRDGNTVAMVGLLLGYAGEWERGVALTESAMSLNPHHPGWYRFGKFFNHYRKGEYSEALSVAQKINMPGYFGASYARTIAQAQLGNLEAASSSLREFLRLYPDFGEKGREEHLDKWLFAQPDLIELIIDGFEKAGLKVQSAEGSEQSPKTSSIEVATRVPLIGRDHERSSLDRMLDELAEGKGALVLLGGEPGVGKTRLASEILKDAHDRGMLALTGHAYEEEGAPFITAAEILEEMVRQVPSSKFRAMLGDNASEMTRLLPELRRRFPDIPEPIDLPLEQQRRYLFKNVLEFLQRASRERPLVMLLDDLHWADESSLLLLEYLAPHTTQLPLMMLGTYRDIELDVGKPFEKTLSRLVRKNLANRVPLKRLQEQHVSALLAVLGDVDPPESLVAAIFEETEGNPFFVTEVFEHLSEEGFLFDANGKWKADLDVRSLDVPEGVRLVIGRRLNRLNAPTPEVLRAGAVIGRDFDVQLLEGLNEWPTDAVLDGIDEAERAKLVVPIGKGRETKYSFTHELIRQTLLSGVSLPRRQRLHLRIAEAMEKVYGQRVRDHASDLANHLYQAGASADPEKTIHYLILAGDRSMGAAAADNAVFYYDAALSIIEDSDGSEESGLLFKLGEASRAQSDWNEASGYWQKALPLLEAEGKTDLATRVYWELAYQFTWRNRRKEAFAFATRGLAITKDGPSTGRCSLLAILGHLNFLNAEFDKAKALLDEASEMAEALGEESSLVSEVLLARIYLYEHTNEPMKMAQTAERAVEFARRTGRPWDVSSALGISILAWWQLGQFDRSRFGAEEVEPLAQQEGDLGTIGHALMCKGMTDMARGDLRSAQENYQRIVDLWKEFEIPWVTAVQAMLGLVQAMQGEGADGLEELTAATENALAGSFQGFEEAHLLLAETYAGKREASDRLEQLASQLPEPDRINGVGAWSVLSASVETAAMLEDLERAAAFYPSVLEMMDLGTVVHYDFGLVEKTAGIAAAAGTAWEDAERHFTAALSLADDLPHHLEKPEVRRWYAWMLGRRNLNGDHTRAHELLLEAVEMYRVLGMPRHVVLAEKMLQDTAPSD